MHGIGNDYVYLDAVRDPGLAERADLAELSRAISDRHRGIGSDGLILVCRAREGIEADVRMRMFNADGSESEMCGNGVRCVAKFAHDRLGVRSRPMRVETGRGVLSIDYAVRDGRLVMATVDMGEPILDLASIPVDAGRLAFQGAEHHWGIETDEPRAWVCTFVSMGNPHAVIFENGREDLTPDRVRALDLGRFGPPVENHRAFPRRTNVHWCAVQSRSEATMRTWERGAGATMACGTGACAVLVAGVLTGRLDREALLHLPGGDLTIRWDAATNHVFKTGPASDVFEGDWPEAPEPNPASIRPESLRTPRLVLRPFAMSDAPAVAALCADREIAATTLFIPHPYTLADAQRWLATHSAAWASGTGAMFAVTLASDGTLVGAIGLHPNRDHNRAELGYWIGKSFWGRGYATEAARAVTRWGFERLGLERIFAYHFASNPASGRVIEKIGMKREGLVRRHIRKWGEYQDSVQYAILRGEPVGGGDGDE